jgi:protein phosphatase
MHDIRSPFESGAATHVGRVRARNEDSYLVRPETGLWAVADGMGGEQSGDLASHTVIEALDAIPAPASAADLLNRCEESMVHANAQLKRIGRERGSRTVIGTTLAALLAYDGYYACLWAGDSRIYRVRGGAIEQVSRDHTEVEAMVQTGLLTPEEARRHPARNVVTRAIGVYDEPELEMEHGRLEPGDTFVICSDGLTAHVRDGEIRDGVVRYGAQQACDALVALTLSRGAIDNVTVVIMRYLPAAGAGSPDDKRQWPQE